MTMRLMFGSSKKLTATLEKGDLCMALPPAKQRLSTEPDRHYLATVVHFKTKKVIFFDDGAEVTQTVEKVTAASVADREATKAIYLAALEECKKLAAQAAEDVCEEAIESVKKAMGGTLGADGAISYTDASGAEAEEGRLLCETLIANFGVISQQSPALRWMSSNWKAVCTEFDVDNSCTISEVEAAAIWDRVSMMVSSMIADKLDKLGAPPRLYRGDLCMAEPAGGVATERVAKGSAAPDGVRDGLRLATYVDTSHATFFDGPEEISEVGRIEHALPADKERAIVRYSMSVSQCKALARRPSLEVVKQAIDQVKKGMGGTLGLNSAIDYTAESGDQAKEGRLLMRTLVDHFAAMKGQSRMVNWMDTNWQAACAQADEDKSGTISIKEAVAIWDRLLIEMTRTFATKIDKLGINPIPLILDEGDFCMAKPLASEVASTDPDRLYLATYVDPSHAIYFDDGDETVVEVAKVGPATSSDKDVAIVKYMRALDQCTRFAGFEAEDLVSEAIDDVKQQMGGTLGVDGKIDYTDAAGDEKREGQILVRTLLQNVGALWDESRSLKHMMHHWQDACKEADADKSNTISEDEAVDIWERVLSEFRKTILGKLQKLGVASKHTSRLAHVSPVQQQHGVRAANTPANTPPPAPATDQNVLDA